MASQSPIGTEDSKEAEDQYLAAWAALRILILEKGQSQSGLELNCAYMNTGAGRFVNVSAITGAEFVDDARSVAPVDWDNDGDLDMLVKNRTAPRLRMMRNDVNSGAHFLAIDLKATQGHPDAIGAQVLIEAGGKTFSRRVYCGDGFLSQRPLRLQFGLGAASVIDKLTVKWPLGPAEVFEGVEMNSLVEITQGGSVTVVTDAPESGAFRGAPALEQLGSDKPVVRVPLVAKMPLGPFPIPSFQFEGRTIKNLVGKPILINMWATWCGGCRKELKEFSERREELDAAGLQIIPMTTEDPSVHVAGLKMLSGYGLSKSAGYADETLLEAFQTLIVEVTGKSESTPMPSSFLVDSEGRLAALYLGPVEVDTLLKDLRRLKRAEGGSVNSTEMFGVGRWANRHERQYRLLAKAFRFLGMTEMQKHFKSIARPRKRDR